MTDDELDVTVFPPSVRAANDPRAKEATWTMLGVDTSGGKCSQCARVHDPDQPHDQRSLAYQYSFHAEHDRFPTWADAMDHCDPDVQLKWQLALLARGIDIE